MKASMKHDYVAIAQEFGLDRTVSVKQIQEFGEKVYRIALDDAFLNGFERRNHSLPSEYNHGVAAVCNAIIELRKAG